jgi:hypothetical protein
MSAKHNTGDYGSAQADPRTAEEWIRQIILFVDQRKDQRKRESLSPEEIGALDGAGRLIFQRQAIVEGICRLMRQRPRADCTVAVYLILVTYSDNSSGRTTVGISRLARLISRHEDNIRKAIDTLIEVGLIGAEAPFGKPRQYWPISHRALANRMGSITWFLDALAPARAPGRPRSWTSSEASNVVTLDPAEKGGVSTRGASEKREGCLHGGDFEKGEGVYAVKGGCLRRQSLLLNPLLPTNLL